MLKNCSKPSDPRRDTARTVCRLRHRNHEAPGRGKRAAEDRRHARRERLFLPPTALFNHIAAHSYGFASEGTYLGVGPESRPLSDVPSNVFPLSTHLLVGGMELAPGGRTS